jgi:hypothetical protein
MIWMQFALLKIPEKKNRLKGKKNGVLKQLKKQPKLKPLQAKTKVKQLLNGKKSVDDACTGLTAVRLFVAAGAATPGAGDNPVLALVCDPAREKATRLSMSARTIRFDDIIAPHCCQTWVVGR